ncbi:hypothetical protein AMS68_007099 [Peltaster fructicola]|uniref:Stress response RCI peptide n=1 Tax=Peltaster fructicola TaxID=286661 RepID=A0A6H0Y3I5_9PEZI|nr:hypothetical protein AMS68_007099 [Peltaster fructicola]
MINIIILVIITIFLPPVGVFLIKGCGADLLINICLTILGYFPGHIHAFYLEYKYYKARDQRRVGAGPGVYTETVPVSQPGYGTHDTLLLKMWLHRIQEIDGCEFALIVRYTM